MTVLLGGQHSTTKIKLLIDNSYAFFLEHIHFYRHSTVPYDMSFMKYLVSN